MCVHDCNVLSMHCKYIHYKKYSFTLTVKDPICFHSKENNLLNDYSAKMALHCKYIRPDYDGTLAIHRTTYYDRTTMNG